MVACLRCELELIPQLWQKLIKTGCATFHNVDTRKANAEGGGYHVHYCIPLILGNTDTTFTLFFCPAIGNWKFISVINETSKSPNFETRKQVFSLQVLVHYL